MQTEYLFYKGMCPCKVFYNMQDCFINTSMMHCRRLIRNSSIILIELNFLSEYDKWCIKRQDPLDFLRDKIRMLGTDFVLKGPSTLSHSNSLLIFSSITFGLFMVDFRFKQENCFRGPWYSNEKPLRKPCNKYGLSFHHNLLIKTLIHQHKWVLAF